MKTVKDDPISILHRVYQHGGMNIFAVGLVVGFDLATPDTLLDEADLWDRIQQAMGKTRIFDAAMPKPDGEVLVAGKCFAPGGNPVPDLHVSVRVGGIGKALTVWGDRHWVFNAGLMGFISPPESFVEMDVSWENAFGGAESGENPLGKGMEPLELDSGKSAVPLPNIEDPALPVVSPSDRPLPAGFMPMGFEWPARLVGLGTFNTAWLMDGWPGFPEDFDISYFNTAPPDQRLDGFFRGDEAIVIENMHPETPVIESRLPGILPRCFINRRDDGEDAFEEIGLVAETVWLFPHLDAGAVIFRGTAASIDDEASGISHIAAFCERREDALRPPSFYWEKVVAEDPAGFEKKEAEGQKDKGAAAQKEKVEEQRKIEGQREKDAPEEREKQAAQGEEEGPVREKREPPKERAGTEKKAALTLKAAEGRSRVLDILDSGGTLAGHDMTGLPLTGIALAGADLTGAVLEGADLSGVELTGARLGKAVLTKARLDGAALSGADLSGVSASGASFAGAVLREADLSGADLTGADLTGADLTGAHLARTALAKARMADARCEGIRAEKADFGEADLSRVDFTEAELTGASMTGAVMDATDFSRAILQDAWLDEVDGNQVVFAGAVMVKTRVSGETFFTASDFSGADLTDARWQEADLSGARLTGALLADAAMMDCRLADADLSGVNAAGADFSKSDLSGADVTRANLFKAALTKTLLVGTDFQGANLYGADLYQADAEGTLFDGANVKNTLLSL